MTGMNKIAPTFISLLGTFCFVISLFAPSAKVIALGAPTDFNGLQVVAWSIGLAGSTLTNFIFSGKDLDSWRVALGIAGVMNILFFLVPFALIFAPSRKLIAKLLFFITLAGLLFGLLSPWFLSTNAPVMLEGYFIWVIGYIFLLTGEYFWITKFSMGR